MESLLDEYLKLAIELSSLNENAKEIKTKQNELKNKILFDMDNKNISEFSLKDLVIKKDRMLKIKQKKKV